MASVTKVNVDGALRKQTNMGAIGVVFRDSHGVLLEASSLLFSYAGVHPLFVKATAMLWVLHEALRLGFQSRKFW